MRSTLSILTWLALALSSAVSFPAASANRTASVSAPASAQSSDVRLQVQTENGRTQFQMGELIPLKLSFTSSALKKYQINMASYDRSGRMGYEAFLLEPETGWSDPLHTYFAYGGFMGGGLSTSKFLSREPTDISLDLNEWVRFDQPGKYTLRVVSRRVGELLADKSYPNSSVELTSNELQLTIIPAGKVWQEATLKKAIAVMDKIEGVGDKATGEQSNDKQAALRTLRYLGSVEATKELARRLRGDDSHTDFTCMFGLVGSPYADVALNEMRRLLIAPDHPVSSTFLFTLKVLMRNAEQPQDKLREEEAHNWETLQSDLLSAVSQKRGKALALSLNTILETISYEQGKSNPLSAQLLSQIATVFDQLPEEKQLQIIEYRWEMIKGPLFLPILRKYARRYKEFPIPNEVNAYNSLHLSGTALLHWYELEPQEARPVIIQEMLRPRPRYNAKILGVLPDKTLPEVEQALAEHFVKAEDYYAAENLASLLERYATDSVLPQILPIVDKNVGKWACSIQAPILAYMLRVNPDLARPRIEAAMAARGPEYSACNRGLLNDVAAMQQDPMLEEIASRSLDDEDPEVAASVATFLGRYGSAAAEEMLWKRLLLWNEKWRGREQELRYIPGERNENSDYGSIGSNLILALATGQSWLADESKLRKLRQLALGQDMQQQVDNMLSDWNGQSYTIFYFPAGKEKRFRAVQYELESLKSLEEKLAQFAPGSSFIWSGTGSSASEDQQMFKELSEFLTGHGMKLSRQTAQQQ
jgi:hypothetical protein